jgi:toxin FitB
MRWLLDTCVLSEVVNKAPAPAVLNWLNAHRQQCVLCVVVLAELEAGALRAPSPTRKTQLLTWIDTLRTAYSNNTVDTDAITWRHFAQMKAQSLVVGQPTGDLDVLIAACARTHGLGVATRNTRHFKSTGVTLTNPWLV